MDIPAEKYDGKDLTKYKLWKEYLLLEVQDLDPTPAHMLNLILKRTTGIANQIAEQARCLELEDGPTEALSEAWNQLDTRFGSPYKPSQQIIHDILHGPTITSEDHDSLFSFAQKCNSAVKLQEKKPISLQLP